MGDIGNDAWKGMRDPDPKRKLRVKICPKYSRPINDAYADGWERTFGKREICEAYVPPADSTPVEGQEAAPASDEQLAPALVESGASCGVEQMAARRPHKSKVAGSSPAPATSETLAAPRTRLATPRTVGLPHSESVIDDAASVTSEPDDFDAPTELKR